MVRLVSVVCLALLVPRVSAADTMVTWISEGEVTLSEFMRVPNTGLLPPVGTPYQLSLSFDPSAQSPTALSAPGSNCFRVPTSGSITLGGVGFGLAGSGFTHAQLPGSNCEPSSADTQFVFLSLSPLDENPWPAIASGGALMEVWYSDLLVRDAFPAVPTAANGLGLQIRDGFAGPDLLVMARGNLRAAVPEQPAPVPEPGTMTLVGLGLAAAIRHARQTRH